MRALIFAQGHTGSTLLERLICATGRFSGYDKLLGQAGSAVFLPVRYIEGHARFRPRRHFARHVKPYHLFRDRVQAGSRRADPGTFLTEMTARGYRILFLRRENILRHVTSNWMAEARRSDHKTDDRPETAIIRVDRARLRGAVEEKEGFAAEKERAIAGIPHHPIIYERDLEIADRH